MSGIRADAAWQPRRRDSAEEAAEKLAKKLAHQRSVTINYRAISGADHFARRLAELAQAIDDYLDKTLTAIA